MYPRHITNPSKNNIVKFRQIKQLAITIPNLIPPVKKRDAYLQRQIKEKHFRDKTPNKEVSSVHQNDDLERDNGRQDAIPAKIKIKNKNKNLVWKGRGDWGKGQPCRKWQSPCQDFPGTELYCRRRRPIYDGSLPDSRQTPVAEEELSWRLITGSFLQLRLPPYKHIALLIFLFYFCNFWPMSTS